MKRLAGKAILVLEDETLISLLVEIELEDAGATFRIAATCAEALHLVKVNTFDAAMLDVRIGDADCREVAEELLKAGIPFIVTTGDIGAPDFGARARLTKPYSEEDLVQALLGLFPAN